MSNMEVFVVSCVLLLLAGAELYYIAVAEGDIKK